MYEGVEGLKLTKKTNRKSRGWDGEVLCEILSMVGVWIYSTTSHFFLHDLKFLLQIFLSVLFCKYLQDTEAVINGDYLTFTNYGKFASKAILLKLWDVSVVGSSREESGW